MARVLKGAPAAAALTEDLIDRAERLRQNSVIPCLAILRVGERADDLAYERAAVKRCALAGIEVRHFRLPENAAQAELMAAISEINRDDTIHGCLMFRPLPKSLDERAACEALDPAKDVDGITAISLSTVYGGAGAGFAPCTAQSCLELLRFYGIDPAGKQVTVVGRSLVIGRPVGMLLMAGDATVTFCHSKTTDLEKHVRDADIVVLAIGKAEAIGAECFRPGQTVLDVGISWSEEKQKLVGDADFEAASSIVSAISPVPGGIGSVTTAVLCKHVVEAAEHKLAKT